MFLLFLLKESARQAHQQIIREREVSVMLTIYIAENFLQALAKLGKSAVRMY